eukprot:EG_transcript_43404
MLKRVFSLGVKKNWFARASEARGATVALAKACSSCRQQEVQGSHILGGQRAAVQPPLFSDAGRQCFGQLLVLGQQEHLQQRDGAVLQPPQLIHPLVILPLLQQAERLPQQHVAV